MNFRRALALAALICAAAMPAVADEAAYVEVSDPGEVARRLFIDMASVRRTGDQAKVEALEIYSSREGARAYAAGPVAVDCDRRTVKPLAGQVFDLNGRVLERRDARDAALPTGAAVRRTLSLVCEDGDGVGALTSFASREDAVRAVRGVRASAAAGPTAPPAIRSSRGVEADRVLDGQAITLPGAKWPIPPEDPPASPAWRFAYLTDGQFSSDGSASVFVDQGEAVRRSGRQLTTWVLYVYWQPNSPKQGMAPIAYSLDRVRYDCASRTYKVLRAMNFDAEAHLLFDGEPGEDFVEAEAGTSDETEVTSACDSNNLIDGDNVFRRIPDAISYARATAERPNRDAKRDTNTAQGGASVRDGR
ncbi:MAG: hypothetical protein U1E50_11815 [Caulobacteraceae bacterium]